MNVTGTADSAGNVLYYEAYLDPVTSRGYNDALLAKLLIAEGLIKKITIEAYGGITDYPRFILRQSPHQRGIAQTGREFLAEANAKQQELTNLMDEFDKLQGLLSVHKKYMEGKR